MARSKTIQLARFRPEPAWGGTVYLPRRRWFAPRLVVPLTLLPLLPILAGIQPEAFAVVLITVVTLVWSFFAMDFREHATSLVRGVKEGFFIGEQNERTGSGPVLRIDGREIPPTQLKQVVVHSPSGPLQVDETYWATVYLVTRTCVYELGSSTNEGRATNLASVFARAFGVDVRIADLRPRAWAAMTFWIVHAAASQVGGVYFLMGLGSGERLGPAVASLAWLVLEAANVWLGRRVMCLMDRGAATAFATRLGVERSPLSTDHGK